MTMDDSSPSTRLERELRLGRIDAERTSLLRVERTDLASGERVDICGAGQHPVSHGASYYVLEPAHSWARGWFHDGPDYPREGYVASVLRDDVLDEGRYTSYAIPRHAARGLLVLFAYAVGGKFRMVDTAAANATAVDVLDQMARNPVNDGIGVIHVPLGYSLAVLDPTGVEFWRRQPRTDVELTR